MDASDIVLRAAMEMDGCHVPVPLQKPPEKSSLSSEKTSHLGTVYFPEGTPASDVCRYIMSRQKTKSGLWLLQMKSNASVDSKDFKPVRDGKHKLEKDNVYYAIYFNGEDMYLLTG